MRLFFTVFKNTAFGMIAQIGIKILSFLFSIFIIRDLGAESYGQYVAILAFGAIFTILSDLGLSPYAVREIARYRGEKGREGEISRLYANILSLRFLLSILTALIIIFSAWATRRPSVMIIAIAINTIGLILYSIQGTAETVLSGHELFGVIAFAKIIQQLFFVIFGGIFLYFGFGFWGLIYANLLGIFVLTGLCIRGIKKLDVTFLGYNTKKWGNMVRSGLPFGLIGFALGLSYKFDTVLLNIFRGDLETGYYNAAYNLVFSAVVLSNVVNTALYPSLTRQAITDPTNLHSIYEKVIKYLLLISLPIAFGVSTLSNQIVEFLYTSDYAYSSLALRIVIWVLPFMYLSEFLGYAVVIGNKERRVARAVLISTGVNIALNLLLVPRFGYLAAAIMTVLTEAILVFQHVISMKIVKQFS
jgi:O-antigen/teichoic acid export membrane protein